MNEKLLRLENFNKNKLSTYQSINIISRSYNTNTKVVLSTAKYGQTCKKKEAVTEIFVLTNVIWSDNFKFNVKNKCLNNISNIF